MDNRKLELVFGFGIIPWLAITATTQLIAKYNIVPLELIQPLSISIPALIGVTGQQMLYRKKKYKQQLKEVSNAKSEKELIEESARCDLEKARLYDKNRVLKKTYDDLQANEIFLKTYTARYNISEKEKDDLTKDELKQKINNIDEVLSEENKTLETLSAKKFLSERFCRVRGKLQRFDYITTYGGLGFLMPLMFYNLPTIIINKIGFTLHTSLFEVLAPGIIGLVVSSAYGCNKRKNQLSAFNSINNELGEEKLPQFRDDSDESEHEQELTTQIGKVSNIKMQLESAKRKLETNQEIDSTINSLAEKTSTKSYKETLIKTIEQYLPMPYKEFKKLDLDEQQGIIDEVKKEQQGNIQKNLFQQEFDAYIIDLEEDIDLHLEFIEEDMMGYKAPKTLKRKIVPRNDSIDD